MLIIIKKTGELLVDEIKDYGDRLF